ncbi:MAG: 16S rRNA (uracil(1498)-N(3))-methyltransferase, partial [Lysobacter sp.]|nr:16S rRNA (uracil(1498)-N(3))-methyltransferase [Lysobacter sp.]
MRTTRIFVDQSLRTGKRIALPEDAAVHLVRVLRMQPGDACVLFNGDGGDYAATIVSANKRGVEADVGARREIDNESPLRITLVQGIARGEKMDWILQKATELGVTEVLPVNSDRSEVKLDAERAVKRLAHWRSVVVSACEQSGRSRVPDVAGAQPLANVANGLGSTRRFLLDPEAADAIATMPAL